MDAYCPGTEQPHHWDIEPPSGSPNSRGECRYCYEIRWFPNYIPHGRWGKDNVPNVPSDRWDELIESGENIS